MLITFKETIEHLQQKKSYITRAHPEIIASIHI